MEWLRKCHHRDLQENGYLRKYQEFIMGDVLDLQASIGRGEDIQEEKIRSELSEKGFFYLSKPRSRYQR